MDGLTLIRQARSVGLSVHLDGDRLVVRGPKSAGEIAKRLLENKPLVVAALKEPSKPVASIPPAALPPLPFPSGPRCRCGCQQSVDVPIHGGQSIRRDCQKCGRFISFSLWYGKPSNN
jgi:hypothetical protein